MNANARRPAVETHATRGPVPVAIVMTSFEPGGTERQMIELIRRLDRRRWTVHLACARASGGWFHRAAEAAASVATFPLHTFHSPDAIRQMWAFGRWCRNNRIAVVHTTELYSNVFGLPGAALGRVPVRIANRREINPDKSTAQIAVQRVAYSFAHKVVANSQAAADRLLFERVPERKVVVVPNGLDFGRVIRHNTRPRLRTVSIVANLRPEKGHDVLIDAAKAILRRFSDARFEVIGSGPEFERLRGQADATQVSHAFAFLGHRDDVPVRLADADIFALPSRSEAFPNAVLEAMAAGLPIVASAVGGMLELIEHQRTGVLVAPGDSAALADAICRLMAEPGLASSLADAARSEAHARYSFDRMVAAFEGVYLSELTRRGSVPTRQPEWAAS